VLFRLRHHQGKNDHQHVVFATSQDLFDNRVSKNIELENVVMNPKSNLLSAAALMPQ
jgi:hypothetical protein